MPVTLDATVGGAASNSYSTMENANAVIATRIGPAATAWRVIAAGTAGDDLKKQALITATADIDTADFKGSRATSTQALEWPRTSTVYASNVLPNRLVLATVEYAMEIAADPTTSLPSPESDNRKMVKAGDVAVEFFESDDTGAAFDLERWPAIVQRLLKPLLLIIAESAWGSALAIRIS